MPCLDFFWKQCNRIGYLDRVDGTERISLVVFHHFKDTSPAKTFQRLGLIVLLASLSQM